jgi:hypothetical protein
MKNNLWRILSMTITLSLSQFIAISSKKSTEAKMNELSHIKNNDYSPGMDYWKPIRSELSKILKGDHDFGSFTSIIENTPIEHNRRANYKKAANKLTNFFSMHDFECLDNTHNKMIWYSKDEKLQVNVSPEFHIRIDNKNYFLKIHYRLRKPNESLNMKNITSSLLLLNEATKDKRDSNTEAAILNLQNKRLITINELKSTSMRTLQGEAATITALYDFV